MRRLSVWPAGLILGLACALAAAQPPAKQPDPKQPEKKPGEKGVVPKPGEKPADKQPEKKPAPKPAEKPMDKQPAPQPQPQPAPQPAGPLGPLDLVKGLREQGMSDLALEYLKDLETSPALSPEQKATIPLEKAKCQLEAADDEPDEAARASLVAEATVGFREFLRLNGKHPRAAEASTALARLKSIEAKAQLVKARRIDVPREDGPEKEKAQQRQRDEAAKARPLFQEAAKLFKDASNRLDAQIKGGSPDPAVRRVLEQEALDAELARGINLFALGDTYMNAGANEIKVRADNLKEAKAVFTDLAKRPNAGRTGWVARAWAAECEFETDAATAGDKENQAILAANVPEAEDGKRMVKFFQLRRDYVAAVNEGDPKRYGLFEGGARQWLTQYGANRRARTEATAIRFYLAVVLRQHAYIDTPFPKDGKSPYSPGAAARDKLKQAEGLFRTVIQSDNEYTDRATRFRYVVVRQLVGEAEKPPADYRTFEECQMAALIQIAKLLDEDKAGADPEALKARRLKIVALLERARVLATDKDNPADVADVLIQLVYFYELTDQPHQAAVLGEYIARTLKTAGGKSSGAGAMALNAYAMSSARIAPGPGLEDAQKADRARAIRLARFVDQRFPNDPATDRARYRLGVLLYEEKDLLGSYEALTKVRAGFDGIVTARLYQGAVVSQLLTSRDSPLADTPDNARKRVEVLRRTLDDLEKLPPPSASADAVAVRAYYAARVRLAMLLFLQPRVDKDGEKANPGYARALTVAQDLLAKLDTFTAFHTADKKLNADGWEAKLLAEDARTRAAYLRANDLYNEAAAGQDPAKYEAVVQVLGPILTEMNNGPYVELLTKQLPPPGAAPAKEPKEPKKDAKDQPKGKDAKEPPKGKEPPKEPKDDDEPEPGGASPAALQQRQRIDAMAAGVDKLRVEVIVMALKARVRQGGDASPLVGLMKTFGGSIEKNVEVLTQLARDVSAQIKEFRKAGQPAQAEALKAGFGKLLVTIAAEPNLSPHMLLFLGQAQIAIEDYGQAIATLQKIPAPQNPDAIRYDELSRQLVALTKAVEAAKTDKEKQDAEDARVTMERRLKAAEPERQAALYYRGACLHLARAYRLAGPPHFPACEALLAGVMGNREKPGWGWTSLEFRQEVALLWEARGAADPNPATAKDHYGKALQEWTTLYQIHKARIDKGVQNDANGNPDNVGYLKNKNAFYDAFFDVQRCLVKANQKLQAAAPEKLAKTMDDVSKRFVDVEKIMGDDLDAAVWVRYAELLEEIPPLRAAYEKNGGKKFLARPAP
ncbi:MAG: hypothetical protein K2P78_05280 [Gemmataceae bacterium]|nr:hypothetical protein [Gemmataceae bacterium]